MREKFVLIFLLLSSFSYPIESPLLNECAQYDDLNFCNSKYDQCNRETKETVDCDSERCDCLRESPISKTECKNYTDDICIHKRQGNTILLPFKVIDRLDESMKLFEVPIQSMKNHCFEELEYEQSVESVENETRWMHSSEVFINKILPAFVLMQKMIQSDPSSKCEASINQMSKAMETFDGETFSTMPFSYEQWHCGWALGAPAQIILRAVTNVTIPNYAGDFNHCCAIERDCYNSGTDVSECGKRLESCTEKILDTLKRRKSGARTLSGILLEISNFSRILKTENRLRTETETKYDTYSRQVYQGFDRSKNFDHLTKTVTHLLEPDYDEIFPDDKPRQEKLQKSNHFVYKYCQFHRNEISSCNYNFIYSKYKNDVKTCYGNIKSDDKKCSDAIGDVRSAFGPQEETWLMWIKKVLYYMLWIALEVVLTLAVQNIGSIWRWITMFWSWIKKQFKKNQPVAEQETELHALSPSPSQS